MFRVPEASTPKRRKVLVFHRYLGRSQVVGCRRCLLFSKVSLSELLMGTFPKTTLNPAPQHLDGRLPCSWYNYGTEEEVAA
jgi:hypothetical protein